MTLKLVVEGASDLAYFAALDRRITELSGRRNAYAYAHELAHHALMEIEVGANDTGMVVFEFVLDTDKASVGWRTTVRAKPVAFPAAPVELPVARPALDLRAWCIDTFVGLPEPTWFSSGSATEANVASTPSAQDTRRTHPDSLRVTFRLSAGSGPLFEAARGALRRFLDSLRRMVRLFDSAIGRLILLIVRNGLRRRLNLVAFVLVILATCRRYGHRSEPDHHASLITRRYLVSMGSCLQT